MKVAEWKTRVVLDPNADERFHQVASLVEEQVAKLIEADMRSASPMLSGELRRSISRQGNIIRITAPHWLYVEFGTKPHPIVAGALQSPPKTGGKKALWWPGAAHPVASVDHPGTPAQPFIKPSVYQARRLYPVRVV